MKAPRSIGDLVTRTVDPALKRRAGMSASLAAQWAGVVGQDLATHSRPAKIRWPKRSKQADDPFEPATLVVAANGIWALRIQHQTTEIMARVNAFFGYQAISRIAVEQKPVGPAPTADSTPDDAELPPDAVRKLDRLTRSIEDDDLRRAIRALGENVMREGGK